MFTVTDLKQMGYCPRIPYYRYCLPGVRVASTFNMAHGAEAGQAVEGLEHRRSLRAYGLGAGQREFDVPMTGQITDPATGETFELNGRLDMLITATAPATEPNAAPASPDREWIPVDYKDSMSGLLDEDRSGSRTGRKARLAAQRNWQVQLAAYALLLEAERGIAVRRGFIYFIPRKRAVLVPIDETLRRETFGLLRQLTEIVVHERMPEPAAFRARCAACEYRLLCNDVG